MIKRLLVANRGEIAVRVIRACRELGVETVAVFSDADDRALHTTLADRAWRLGPAPPGESYLSIANIMRAAEATSADAVHPGYGFLAEQAALATACSEAGLVFVGPPADVIARMGSKIESRRTMHAAGVPIVPGVTPADQSDEGVLRAIEEAGYPVIVKASAGGGGKGMRIVREAREAQEKIQAARREAVSAFGDGTLYVERRLDRPHHVEVQVMADNFGRVVHLFERECSAQRRHQKIIEESPSPSIDGNLRRRMCDAAVQAARAVSYRNAGTVEFLVERTEGRSDAAPFYFLEMNTRLQVEHPVTESVVGVDLVHAQFLVASGEPLPWAEGSLTQRGHAIEARVYAEDPGAGFLPQAGRLLLYREPQLPGVRVDSGVVEGDTVSVHYDPLLAKVIATAESRRLAIDRLSTALRQFPVLGIRTNIPFLLRVLEHHLFVEGALDTAFLDTEGAALATTIGEEMPASVRAAVSAYVEQPAAGIGRPTMVAEDPWERLKGWGR